MKLRRRNLSCIPRLPGLKSVNALILIIIFAGGLSRSLGSDPTVQSVVSELWTQVPLPRPFLSPKPNNIGDHDPDFTGIIQNREFGILMQRQIDGSLDGGDSAHKTGIMAFCNSEADKALLAKFEAGGFMVRHPTQKPHSDPKNCSRDQLIAYMAGCWRAGKTDIAKRLLAAHEARKVCQNGDLLGPHEMMFLRACCGIDISSDYTGHLALEAAIEYHTEVDPWSEQNAMIVESIVCGHLNSYVRLHPDYQKALNDYWSGWRGETQIAEEMIWVVKKELERYTDRTGIYPMIFPAGLPKQTITLLTNIGFDKIISGTVNPVVAGNLYGKYLNASTEDLKSMKQNLEKNVRNYQRGLTERFNAFASKELGSAWHSGPIWDLDPLRPLDPTRLPFPIKL